MHTGVIQRFQEPPHCQQIRFLSPLENSFHRIAAVFARSDLENTRGELVEAVPEHEDGLSAEDRLQSRGARASRNGLAVLPQCKCTGFKLDQTHIRHIEQLLIKRDAATDNPFLELPRMLFDVNQNVLGCST